MFGTTMTRGAFMKRGLKMSAAALVGAALVSLGTAAGTGAAAETAQPGSSATARKPRIAVSIPAADHGWTAGVKWWADQAVKNYPDAEWTVLTAADPAKQIADIEDMMAKGVDGLVILATESAPLTPVAREAHERGIFIVNVDRGFTEPVADIFLEGDNKAFGRKSAQFMVERMDGKGNLVILRGIPCTVDTDRYEAAMEVFNAYPNIKVLTQVPAYWNREKGLAAMEDILQQFPKIDAVWAQDDDILLGAMQAVKEAGREKEMWMLGGAGMKEVVKMVMDKDKFVPANITYPPSMIGTGIHMAYSVLRDGNREQVMQYMPKHMMLDVELITPENAKQFYFPDSVY